MQKLTSHDPEAQSLDLVADNIEKLSTLFPDILTEGEDGRKRVDFEALRELLGQAVEEKDERYNFTWYGKAQARRLAQTPSLGTLRPCVEESKHWETTQNLFIEGDNLEVLKLLQKSYHQRVKMIYIDPPYNTGKDFIYPDDYRDNLTNYLELTGQVENGRKLGTNTEASGRYHTNWLNMMYPRLKLARNLLQDDGVIFISIDDTEVANLRKICDEIFGEENFIAVFPWKRRTGANDSRKFYISQDHEYILAYARTFIFAFQGMEKNLDNYNNPDNDSRGAWARDNLTCNKTADERPNLYYPITDPLTGNTYQANPNRVWVYEKARMEKNIEEGKVLFPINGIGTPMYKRHLSELRSNRKPLSSWIQPTNDQMEENGEAVTMRFPLNMHATKQLRALLDVQLFDFPKSSLMIQEILNQTTQSQNQELVLDFFSGSGTTAHAVMALNAADGGSRRFIMVQLPEPTDKPDYPTIADIGKERIRRAGEKILADQGGIIPLDIGFKVFKLDSTNIKPWDTNFDTLEQDILTYTDSLKPNRSTTDVLYEILLKYGLDLSLPLNTHTIEGNTVYSMGGALVLCLDDSISLATVEGMVTLIAQLQAETPVRVVFRDAGFADDVVKLNAVQILKQAGIEDVRSV